MKNGPIFLLGLFLALLISWGGIVLGSHVQLGSLTPYFDESQIPADSHPQRSTGLAARGQLVYAELGCAACHTQQVRRPDFGSDKGRGWGERQSVARDYIFQARPQLGASRLGPDLANYGARQPNVENLYALLYNGSQSHPSYKFLFAEREIEGEGSARALKLAGVALPANHQIVPSERAQTLVAYLLGLNQSYVYPEARPFTPEKPAPAAGAAPQQRDEKPIPATAPDEQKNRKAGK